jgi:hypothetical protein
MAFFFASSALRAELMPSFEMERCVGEARLIVRGTLDRQGNLQPLQLLKGESMPLRLVVADGAQNCGWLAASMKDLPGSLGEMEVVAFLREPVKDRWPPVMGAAGVAGLDKTGVYLFGAGREDSERLRQPTAWRDEHFTKDSFLAAITAQVKLSAERDALLARPRSAERVRGLVAFLGPHGEPYHRWRILQALRPIEAGEQGEVLQEIAQTEDVPTKAFLLGLAGSIPLTPAAFDAIAPLIDSTNPPALRRAALAAISGIDQPRTAVAVLPLLTLAEPELDAALAALGPYYSPPSDARLDLRVVEALLSLAKEVRQRQTAQPVTAADSLRQPLLQQLTHYAHPKLACFYAGWVLDQNPPAPEEAMAGLQAILGTRWPRETLKAWWEQHRAALEADYDLQSGEGRTRWFGAYHGADEVTQRLLMQRWIFAPVIDEPALIQAALHEDSGSTAKATLAELWRVGRLSNDGRKAVFEKFFEIKLVEEQVAMNVPHWRELKITGAAAFPFRTEIQYRSVIAVDREPVLTSGFDSSVGLEPKVAPYNLGSLGGAFPGRTASAILEIRQLDYAHDRKELWRLRRVLGPIELVGR